jgi:DNA-binding transcriptional ArsR family regulator
VRGFGFSFDISKIVEVSKQAIIPSVVTTREKIHHPPTESLDLATIMRTLGDPARLDIVRLLADGTPRMCSEISAVMGQPNSTCSYHLRLMREAGITRARAQGTHRLISLRDEDLEARFPGLLEVLTARLNP